MVMDRNNVLGHRSAGDSARVKQLRENPVVHETGHLAKHVQVFVTDFLSILGNYVLFFHYKLGST
jgi:hypothetical protein